MESWESRLEEAILLVLAEGSYPSAKRILIAFRGSVRPSEVLNTKESKVRARVLLREGYTLRGTGCSRRWVRPHKSDIEKRRAEQN